MMLLPLLLVLATFPVASDAATCGFVNWFSMTTLPVRIKMANNALSAAHTTSDLVDYKAVTYFTCPESSESLYIWAEDNNIETHLRVKTTRKLMKAGGIRCDGANLFKYVPDPYLARTAGADPKIAFSANHDASGNRQLVSSTGVDIFFMNYGEGTNTPVTLEYKPAGTSSWKVLGPLGNFGEGKVTSSSNSPPYQTDEIRYKGNDGTILASGTVTSSASDDGLGIYVALIGTFTWTGAPAAKEAVVVRGCSSGACYTCSGDSDSDSTGTYIFIAVGIVLLLAGGGGAYYYFYHFKSQGSEPSEEGVTVAAVPAEPAIVVGVDAPPSNDATKI